MRLLFLVFFINVVALCPVKAQVTESFSDGDFTQNPTWSGDVEVFTVNAAQQLQSNGPAVSGTTLALTTANQLAVGAQWEFYVQLAFATSASNYAEVHLLSDVADVKGASRGYFVRLGGTEDEVSLYRKDGTTASRIINGPDKTIAAADNKVWVRVTRTATHTWTLELDVTGTKENYALQGTVTDNRYVTAAFTGILFKYTQANAKKFYFDEYTVKDISVLGIADVEVLDARSLKVAFTQPLQEDGNVKNPANYRLNDNLLPVRVEWEATAPQHVQLYFNRDFTSGPNALEIFTLTGRNGNQAKNLKANFNYSPVAAPGDVRITEIYADVNPVQDLPAAEFFEIYNRTDKTFQLEGWRYSDATTSAGTFPAYALKPGQYLIVCAAADTALYQPFGAVVGLPTFPSLNDAGDDVKLFDQTGKLIDFVRYTSAWYQETAKREGGWSLELINVNSQCAGASQWKGAENPRGGTPGQPNSVQVLDGLAPELAQVYALSSNKILLRFTEPLDSVPAQQINNYSVTPGLQIQSARLAGTSLTDIELTLATPLAASQRYTVTVNGLKDCAGNVTISPQMAAVVLPSFPEPGDVVISEILFNPYPNGVDFLEIMNRSGKFLNLKDWKIANRQAGNITNPKVISQQHLLLGPGQYVAITTSPEALKKDYPAAVSSQLLAVSSLPTFSDDAGTAVLVGADGAVLDEISYQSSQHFKLLRDAEGVSLERISLAGPSVPSNFHSAASTVKATPGYRNSQARDALGPTTEKLTLSPKTITPDGDGVDDILLLQFTLPQPGFVATIQIYDAHGRVVKRLAGNTLLGTETLLQWDGLTDNQTKAALGYYIILAELFNLQGQREVLKQTVVVGGRF